MMPPSTHLRRGYRGFSLSEAKRKPTGHERISMGETQPSPRRGLLGLKQRRVTANKKSYVSIVVFHTATYTTWFFGGEEGAVLEVGG